MKRGTRPLFTTPMRTALESALEDFRRALIERRIYDNPENLSRAEFASEPECAEKTGLTTEDLEVIRKISVRVGGLEELIRLLTVLEHLPK